MKLAVVLAFLAAAAPAQTLPPQFFDLGSESQNASLTMMCDGERPYRTMTCQFLSVSVDVPSPTEHRAAFEKLRRDLSAESDQKLMQEKDQTCRDLSKREVELTQHLAGMTPERAAYGRAAIMDMMNLCACQNRTCITTAMLRQKESEKNECRINALSYTLKFKKVGGRRWVSNNGPEGICGVVSVQTLEHEEKYENVWTYTESSVVGNTEPELCKSLASQWQKPEIFSWKIGSALSPQCSTLVLTGSHIGPKE
jgi:hypothetical protein